MGVKVNVRSRGLGDTIAKFTHATKIDTVAKTVAKVVTGSEDCGCAARQEALNKMFPYNNK